jgi:hypothetical protein
VVDPEELRLVDVLVQLVGQLGRRLAVVAERLLDDDTPALGEARLGEPGDDAPEQERRDLEVEDGVQGAVQRGCDALVCRAFGEVSAQVREALGELVEHLLVQLLARAHDRLARTLAQLVVGPVVDRDADDRAVEEAALLEPVERAKRHHFRQVAGDAEDDENIGRLRLRSARDGSRGRVRCLCHVPPPRSVARH